METMLTINSKKMKEISGLSQTTLDRWCAAGFVDPVNNGRGQGHHREFTLMETVALTYARNWGSLPLTELKKIAACILNFSEEELRHELSQNRRITFLIPGRELELTAPPYDFQIPDSLNLKLVYEKVKEKFES